MVVVISLICCVLFCCAHTFWRHSKNRLEIESNEINQQQPKLPVQSTSNHLHDIDDRGGGNRRIKGKVNVNSKTVDREQSPSRSHSHSHSHSESYSNPQQQQDGHIHHHHHNNNHHNHKHGNHQMLMSSSNVPNLKNRQSEPAPYHNGPRMKSHRNPKRKSLQTLRQKDRKSKTKKGQKQRQHQSMHTTSATTHYQNVQTQSCRDYHKHSVPIISNTKMNKNKRQRTMSYNNDINKQTLQKFSNDYNNIRTHTYNQDHHRMY